MQRSMRMQRKYLIDRQVFDIRTIGKNDWQKWIEDGYNDNKKIGVIGKNDCYNRYEDGQNW